MQQIGSKVIAQVGAQVAHAGQQGEHRGFTALGAELRHEEHVGQPSNLHDHHLHRVRGEHEELVTDAQPALSAA